MWCFDTWKKETKHEILIFIYCILFYHFSHLFEYVFCNISYLE